MKEFWSRRNLLALVLLLAVIAAYWLQVLAGQRAQLAYAEDQARLRAMRVSEALALQVSTLFSGLEYLASSLATKYLTDKAHYFPVSVQTALNTFPDSSISQIAVADAQGNIVYSSLGQYGGIEALDGKGTVSIADREHFRVHVEKTHPELFISHPVFGRLSGRWGIQVSYPLRRDQQFLGVLVVSISPDYISDKFREVFADGSDVALLLHADGSYLARSSEQERVLRRKVPSDRDFLHNAQQESGQYVATTDIDGIERYYAWHRVQSYPLVVSIGLERSAALMEVQERNHGALLRNAFGTLLVTLSACWIMFLFARLRKDQRLLRDSEERYKLALLGGDLGAWDWNLRTGRIRFDSRWAAMFGYDAETLAPDRSTIDRLIHPDDAPTLQADLDRHFCGDSPLFESVHRMRHRDGHWMWISARGKVTNRSADGLPLRMVGTQADISAQVDATRMRNALFDNSAAEIFLTHPHDRMIRMANRRAIETFSPDGKPLAGRSMRLLHCSDESYQAFESIYGRLAQQGRAQVEYPLQTGSGEPRWFSVYGTRLDPDAPEGEIIWTMLDTTERRQAEQALADSRARLTQIIQHFPGGILVEDESGKVLVANHTLCLLLAPDCGAVAPPAPGMAEGCDCREALRTALADLAPAVDQVDAGVAADWQVLRGDRIMDVRMIPVAHAQGSLGMLWIVQDVTERLRHERHLNQLATTDMLTGLSNRRYFMAVLEQELARPGGAQGMVMMLDLDHFKHVNDTYGHAVGDEVLRFLAGVFQRVLRKSDLPGRLGGEEFAVLLAGTGQEEALAVAERLRETLAQSRIPTAAGEVQVTISIGVARLMPGGNAAAILEAADAALYRAKHNGRNRVELAELAIS